MSEMRKLAQGFYRRKTNLSGEGVSSVEAWIIKEAATGMVWFENDQTPERCYEQEPKPRFRVGHIVGARGGTVLGEIIDCYITKRYPPRYVVKEFKTACSREWDEDKLVEWGPKGGAK